MGTRSPSKDQSLIRRFLPWVLYALLPLALIRIYLQPPPLSPPQSTQDELEPNPIIITTTTTSSSSSRVKSNQVECDYTKGEWVSDESGPLYNGTTCGTIKEGQNCIAHGRPDNDYLYWRWRPEQCELPRFEPSTFLQLLKNKHLAFVGDSMARNQLESLLCQISSLAPPELVYSNGEENKFRRWHFGEQNITVSIYWSPFLVKGIEKSLEFNYNRLYLDFVDERWAADLDSIHVLVLSIGHWFLHPAVYHENEVALGCHYCPDLNHTEVGFYDVFRKAFKTTLKTVIEQRRGNSNNAIDVIVTTFSPSHFEGEWDKAGACPKTEPFKEGEKALEWMDAEMRSIQVQEVNVAKENAAEFPGLRVEALDVTKLSIMRPDGHPGPYMNPFPFADGVKDRVQNDCVHWCLPGPIDTWNEILLELIKKWEA